jgi:hypothetical protein
MNIQPTHVTFKQAKLLKEKGFDGKCNSVYTTDGNILLGVNVNLLDRIYAPEQWQVVEWLRVNHSIHIEVLLAEDYPWDKFYYRAMRIGGYFTLSHDGVHRETPQEAYSAAFDYVLNNLI